jgi:hypothetical protein
MQVAVNTAPSDHGSRFFVVLITAYSLAWPMKFSSFTSALTEGNSLSIGSKVNPSREGMIL